MGFIDSIRECFSPDELPKEPVYRAVIFGDGAAYFENVCSVLSFSMEEIVLSLRKGGLIVSGCCLYIKKYCAGDVVICGKITKIERV